MAQHVHIEFGTGIEYCEQCQALMIDVRKVTGIACLTEVTRVQETCVLACWRAFRKACPHRTVRELVVKGVG